MRPRPVWARPRSRRGARADSGNYQRAVVRGRVSASSQTPHYSKVGVALLKVPFPLPDFPGALPRREHAGDRAPVPVPAVAPIKVSPQYLCLNVVTVARLVQTLAHQ